MTVTLALSLSPGACPQRSKAGSVSGVLGAQAEMLPGISILPLQLMPLEALPRLSLAANVPAGRWESGSGGGRGVGGCPAHTKWALVAETPCQGRGRGVSYVTGPSGAILSGSPAAEPCLFLLLITSLLWFLPGEELDREKQRMLFKSVLLETRSKQEGFVWLPGQARADAEEGGPASRERGAFSLLPTPGA